MSDKNCKIVTKNKQNARVFELMIIFLLPADSMRTDIFVKKKKKNFNRIFSLTHKINFTVESFYLKRTKSYHTC